MFYSQDRRAGLKVSDPELKFGEIAKKIGAEWKVMEQSKKESFAARSVIDKERYNSEMKSYVPPANLAPDSEKRKKRKKKDPNAPKRSKSAYMFFAKERRPELVKEQPTLTFGEYGKAMGVAWGTIEPSIKAKFEQQAAKDKVRYAKEMESYRATLGNV